MRTTMKRSVISCTSPVVNSLILPSTKSDRILISMDFSSWGPIKNGTLVHGPKLTTLGLASAKAEFAPRTMRMQNMAIRTHFIAQGYDDARKPATIWDLQTTKIERFGFPPPEW